MGEVCALDVLFNNMDRYGTECVQTYTLLQNIVVKLQRGSCWCTVVPNSQFLVDLAVPELEFLGFSLVYED